MANTPMTEKQTPPQHAIRGPEIQPMFDNSSVIQEKKVSEMPLFPQPAINSVGKLINLTPRDIFLFSAWVSADINKAWISDSVC